MFLCILTGQGALNFGNAPPPITTIPCDYGNPIEHMEIEKSGSKVISAGAAKPSGRLYEIYLKNIGLIPNYSGHIPGARFRYGATFGNDTVNAKRSLN